VGMYLLWRTPHRVTGSFAILALCLALCVYAPASYWSEVESIEAQNYQHGTGKERVESWEGGWKMFLDHPIIGVGAMNFGVWLPDYYPLDWKKNRMWGRVAHSLYFTILPEMGLIGTMLFVRILLYNRRTNRLIAKLEEDKGKLLAASSLPPSEREAMSRAIRTLYFISLAYKGAMIGFLVTGTFISVFWYGYFWSITAAVVVTGNLARKLEDEIRAASRPGADGRVPEDTPVPVSDSLAKAAMP
ncbi:MAG: O-antigen ligase family protein, partial [Desulfobacteraceae bacterium]|nr:O-antigen ligase family protein [Desulfobacteraceae bacterium]